MFTSRAEYRLSLREDNADSRLTEEGRALGLIDDSRWNQFNRKRDAVAAEVERLRSTWVNPHIISEAESIRVLGKVMEREYSLFDLLRRPEVAYDALMSLSDHKGMNVSASCVTTDKEVVDQVEVQAKYQGYIERQKDEVAKGLSHESTAIPAEMDYKSVHGLSIEVQQRLNQARPETLGQASRIQGVTPAAISLLLVHLKRRKAA
jgi:tRNA uridine 5-carboxymethylaminomethyl modification enzyme